MVVSVGQLVSGPENREPGTSARVGRTHYPNKFELPRVPQGGYGGTVSTVNIKLANMELSMDHITPVKLLKESDASSVFEALLDGKPCILKVVGFLLPLNPCLTNRITSTTPGTNAQAF